MGIMQAVRGNSLILNISASSVSRARSGFIQCGNPGNTGTPGTVVSGGSGNYSYLWTLSGAPSDHGPYTCSNTTVANPVWSGGIACEDDVVVVESWKLSVTDNSTGLLGSITISVTRRWTNLS